MRTIPDYSEWETLTLYFYRFLVRNSTNSYLSYYQIHNIYINYFFTRFTQFEYSKKDNVVVRKSIHSHFPDQTKNNREENN